MNAVKMLRLDVLSMRVYAKSYLILIIYPVLFYRFGPTGLALMCGIMFAVLSGSIFSLQEKNRLERLYSVMAISERGVVLGRYLFMLGHCLAVVALLLPIQAIIATVTGNPSEDPLLLGMGLAFFLFWLVGGIQAPLYFRYGYTKMRTVAYLPILLIALLPFVVVNFMPKHYLDGLEGMAEQLMAKVDAITAILFAAGVLFAGVSFVISLRGYRKAKG